ncbi:MAG: ornithine--oxo-acid transaminase [Actinomycetota bacterium]|nr:ornithine--oxo-acid transaminase [Actinomycetota bacterium]
MTIADYPGTSADHVALIERHAAPNYRPLPVVIAEAEGAWVVDVEGRRYLDCLAGYSALNFGHRHPRLVAAAIAQLGRVTLTSRAFNQDQLGPFCAELAALTGTDMVLPMNTGAEAVETALKIARRWGYDRKGVAADTATIVVMAGNFHGRTISIVSFSDDPEAHGGFGPLTPGFRTVPYGDIDALTAAVDDTTVAVLLEPVQGEAGVIIPPAGFLSAVRRLCDQKEMLFIADEIQSGLGRTGTTFACDAAAVTPDLFVLGKALGGGIVPVSAVAGRTDVMSVIGAGQHGSTFGGNPLACAVGRAVVELLREGSFQQRAAELSPRLRDRLLARLGHGLTAVRCVGLWAGVDIDPRLGTAHDVSLRLLDRGVLAKDTHEVTLRFAPPLVVTAAEIDWAVDQLVAVLDELA